MSLSKISKIVTKLHTLTLKGSIEWEPTEKEGIYQVSFPDFTIRLSTQPSKEAAVEPGTLDYFVSIYNSSGTMIESLSDIDLQEVDQDAYKKLKETYESAKGYALGVEQTLDSIISTLDQEELPF